MTAAPSIARETRTAPPKRWRNWWWAKTEGGWDDGDTTNPIADPAEYPTKDVAESVAAKQLARLPPLKRPLYLGAFPVGGA